MDFGDAFPAEAGTAIQLTFLDLVSCEPIEVLFDGEPSVFWDVEVQLSVDQGDVPDGLLSATSTHENSGTYSADFFVLPRFTFINVDNPTDVKTFDAGTVPCPVPALMETVGLSPFVFTVTADPPPLLCGTNFAPGVEEDPVTLDQCCKKVGHAAAPFGHIHETDTADCSACPTGACRDPSDGSCEVVQTIDNCAGEYKGDGTDCTTDSDGDGIPDVLENADCCAEGDLCNFGTDPNNADTDGDGCGDLEEIEAGTDPCDPCDPDPPCATSSGAIILAGHDADDHGFEDIYAGLFDELLANTGPCRDGILVIGADPGTLAASWIASVACLMAVPQTVTFVNNDDISTVDFSPYAILHIPSHSSETSGGIGVSENSLLTARAIDVADFVNSGGSLFGLTQHTFSDAFGYLGVFAAVTALAESYDDISVTPAGEQLGITDVLDDVCCWHNVFTAFPDFLNILATANEPSSPDIDGQAAMLGGSLITIPGQIALEPALGFNPPNTDHMLTASVVDATPPFGPLADVEVTFQVISGPNAGDTGEDITDVDGQATFMYTGDNGIGVDNIRASFVDPGSMETVESNIALKFWDADCNNNGTPDECEDPLDLIPNIIAHPSDQVVCDADAVSFSVSAEGPAPLSYQWREFDPNSSMWIDIPGAVDPTYTIDPVAPGDAGDYDVVVTNACGEVTSDAAMLTVEIAPSITDDPDDGAVCEADAATFSVAAAGTGLLSYQWRKDGVDLVDGGNISGATSDMLTIDPVSPEDGGVYDAVVTNPCASATSTGADLNVELLPTVADHPQNSTVCLNGGAVFTVSASGAKPLSYQWRKDGVELIDGGNVSGATTDTLLIDPVEESDEGMYHVVVTNSCDSASSNTATLTLSQDFELCAQLTWYTMDGGGAINTAGDDYVFSGTIGQPDVGTMTGGDYRFIAGFWAAGPIAAPCPGDTNGDGEVNPLDSGFVLARFGCLVGTGDPDCDAADVNADGAVDPLDSGFVLARFGICR